jgi:hypothetical protein
LTAISAAADGEDGDSRASRTGAEPLGPIVFALLVLACFAAFFLTQRLKHTPTAVQRFQLTPSFSPTLPGHIKQERISFKLARADEVTVAIIDTRESVVATLVRDHRLSRYKQFSLRWNGREGTARRYRVIHSPNGHATLLPDTKGRLAPAGEYRVRLSLRTQSRTALSPRSFKLVGR